MGKKISQRIMDTRVRNQCRNYNARVRNQFVMLGLVTSDSWGKRFSSSISENWASITSGAMPGSWVGLHARWSLWASLSCSRRPVGSSHITWTVWDDSGRDPSFGGTSDAFWASFCSSFMLQRFVRDPGRLCRPLSLLDPSPDMFIWPLAATTYLIVWTDCCLHNVTFLK